MENSSPHNFTTPVNTPPETPKQNRSRTKLIISLTATILVVLGFLVWSYADNQRSNNQQKQQSQNQTQLPSSTSSKQSDVDSADTKNDWKTVSNTEYGFELKLPPTMTYTQKSDTPFSPRALELNFKGQKLNGYLLVNDPGRGTGFTVSVSSESFMIGDVRTDLEIMDSITDNERAAVLAFSKYGNDYFWLFRFNKNDNQINLIKETFSSFKFTTP